MTTATRVQFDDFYLDLTYKRRRIIVKTIPRDDITEATPGGRHYETNDFVSVSTLAADDRCLYVGGISGELVVQDIISGRILYDGFLSTHENAITNGLEIARLGGRASFISAIEARPLNVSFPSVPRVGPIECE